MGPRTGVDAVGGGNERFLRSLNFFRPSVLDRPFWIARFGSPRFEPPVFGPPVFGPPRFGAPVLERLFRTAHLLLQFNPPRQLGTSRYLMVPHGSWILRQRPAFYSTDDRPS